MDDETASRILSYINALKIGGLNISLVTCKEKLHITLAFLGETDVGYIPVIKKLITNVAQLTVGFSISSSRTEYFKESGALWIGFGDSDAERLKNLADNIHDELASKGIRFNGQHDFTAHLTIGRNRQKVLMPGGCSGTPHIVIPVNRIALLESLQQDGKTIYEELHVAELAQPRD